MVMESPLKMLSDVDVRQTLTLRNGLIGSNENMEDNIGREIGLLMQEQCSKEIIDRERGLNIYRSGSAPPTVEGSMTAVGSLFRHSNAHFSGINGNGNANGVLSEEEIRSHPSYLSYYYSHENLNPRLPPPLLTKEDWRIAQRFQSGASSYGGFGDTRRKELINESNSKSLFSSQPGRPAQSGEAVLSEPRKVTPRNLNQQPLAEWLERGTDGLIGLAGVGLGSRRKSLADMLQEGLGRPTNISAPLSRPVSHNAFDDFVDPLGASDLQLKHLRNGMESVNGLSSRATSPGLVRVQSFGSSISHSFSSVVGSSLPRSTTPEAPLVGRSPSPCLPPVGGRVSAADRKNVTASNVFNGLSSSMGDCPDIAATLCGLSLSKNGLVDEDGDVHSQLQQKFDDQTNIMFDRPNGHRKSGGNHVGSGLQEPTMDPLYIQYLSRTSEYAAYLNDPSLGRNHIGTSHGDLLGFQKEYLEALIAQQKQQYGVPFIGKSGGLNHGYYESRTFGLGMPYPENPIANPIEHNERILRFPSMVSSSRGSIGSWHSGNIRNIEGSYASSLMEEFKNNRTKCFELLDIIDHVVEFSVDQYGSRFIQQKLETATVEEKNKIFPEIIPHARTLMTDVFGNYVIQKFFEHGTESQRKELASQLIGHVLPLSLQMYGCRVIQKALEMVDMDEKTRMVAELDGVVMKCVRDQNGNHVIQKCIECVPENQIQFIISTFYGQVVALSTHPYGCRVIQRVLEHCNDLNTLHIIMSEILQSICTLAQDQYGNYVVQHVLQHGKPHERSAIIKKLAGQIVKMSQQKFASNVVEKCLTSGGPEERQLLINEMLGSTDKNEPLQAMMKDPYGNYVVQKVLETCDNQSRELILSRIKVHLNALTRYTYGKHVVARVEKLITTGERHIGISSSYSL